MLVDPIHINYYGVVALIPTEGVTNFQIEKAFGRQIFNDPVQTDIIQTSNGIMLRRPVGAGAEQVVLGPHRIETQTIELGETIRILEQVLIVYRNENYSTDTTAHGINFNIDFNNDEDIDPQRWIAQNLLSDTLSPENSNALGQLVFIRIPNFGNSTYTDLTFKVSNSSNYKFNCYVNIHYEEVRAEIIHGQELEDLVNQCSVSIEGELRRIFNT